MWTQDEIAALLSGPLSSSDEQTLSHLFCYNYGVEPQGNVAPHQVSVSGCVCVCVLCSLVFYIPHVAMATRTPTRSSWTGTC